MNPPPPDNPPPDNRTTLRRTAQNFALFFSLLPPQFSFFFLSLGVLSWNFVGVLEGRNPEMCIWALGLSCETRRPHQTGPPGLAHDSPRTPNVHISGPLRFKHHQNSTKRPPKREKEERKLWRRRRKNSAKFWVPHPSGLHPSGFHLSGLHPSGPHFFWVWASTLWGPPFEGPTLCRPKIQHPKIGRSRNWPKSTLAEVEKKELAEVEIGRSRSPPAIRRLWPPCTALPARVLVLTSHTASESLF